MIFFDTLEKQVHRAKSDKALLNRIITEQQGFASMCIRDFKGKYGIISEDDESTIALLALEEAILKYEPEKGKFHTYAKLVIQRRLIDEYRRNKKNFEQLNRSLDQPGEEDDEGTGQTRYEVVASLRQSRTEEDRAHLQTDVQLYAEALQHYDLTYADLVDASPKNDDTKALYQQMAAWLASDPRYRKAIEDNGRVPLAELEAEFGMNRKKLERGRRYILAMYVLITGDFDRLKSYIRKEAAP